MDEGPEKDRVASTTGTAVKDHGPRPDDGVDVELIHEGRKTPTTTVGEDLHEDVVTGLCEVNVVELKQDCESCKFSAKFGEWSEICMIGSHDDDGSCRV